MPEAAAMKLDRLEICGAKEKEGEGQEASPMQKLLQDLGLPPDWSSKEWEFPESREGCCVTKEEIERIEAAFGKKNGIAAIEFILRLDQYRWKQQQQQAKVKVDIIEERAEPSLLIVSAPASALAVG